MRLFLAALLPGDTAQALAGYVRTLKPLWEGVRWERVEKLHVTLRFLGEVGEARAAEISEAAAEAASRSAPMELTFRGLAAFPDFRTPRVIVARLGPPKDPKVGLAGLKKDLDEGLARLGFEVEARDFKPHVTLGRAKDGCRRLGTLPMMAETAFVLDTLALMRSTPGPGGSVYTPLETYALG